MECVFRDNDGNNYELPHMAKAKLRKASELPLVHRVNISEN